MLLAIDLYQDFVDVEDIAIAPMLSLESSRVQGTELDAPEPNRFASDCDSSLSQEIFYIAVTEVETEVEPDGIRNDIWRESVALISIDSPIIPKSEIQLGGTAAGSDSRLSPSKFSTKFAASLSH